MSSHFFALFSRMKNINRWALMRNTKEESLASHALEAAAIAHCLALIGNTRLGKNYPAADLAVMGMYHDLPEILTGDMPTPAKYYSPAIREAYQQIETAAARSILETLPADLRPAYAGLLQPDETQETYRLLKAADKISALIKCIEERNTGNLEFSAAERQTLAALHAMECEEAEIFLTEFMDSYSEVLDAVLKKEEGPTWTSGN